MGKFIGDLILKDTGEVNSAGRSIFELYEPFSYEIGNNGSHMTITCPVGYKTDMASIPRFFWRLIPPAHRHNKASVIHDFCCDCKNFPRIVTDAIFYDCLDTLKISVFRKVPMYIAVRLYWILIGRWFKHDKPYKLECNICSQKH